MRSEEPSTDNDSTDNLTEDMPTNMERLLQHLQPDSFAARLVLAHGDASDPKASLKKAVAERLYKVRGELEGTQA